jgi:hypothetical protein
MVKPPPRAWLLRGSNLSTAQRLTSASNRQETATPPGELREIGARRHAEYRRQSDTAKDFGHRAAALLGRHQFRCGDRGDSDEQPMHGSRHEACTQQEVKIRRQTHRQVRHAEDEQCRDE